MDLTGLVLDVSAVFTAGTAVALAIGSIWGIKKVIKLLNRS